MPTRNRPHTGDGNNRPAMLMMEVETIRPRVNGRNSIESVEDQLEYRRGKENVTTKSRKSFEIKVFEREASGTPTNSPIMGVL